MFPRSSGLLLHVTSLPGGHGIGDLGPAAHDFLDFLESARQTWWQVLPLVPPGRWNSPYASPSAFAGSPLLISLDALAEQGLLDRDDRWFPRRKAVGPADHAHARRVKSRALLRAYRGFRAEAGASPRTALRIFRELQHFWLPDHCLFLALSERYKTTHWTRWPKPVRERSPEALARARAALADRIGYHEFVQFVFHEQWRAVRQAAGKRGVRLFGDLPIFVSHQSADVWAHRDLFRLDSKGNPTVVAGVPPDLFAATGQLWGNPHYRWDRMKKRGYAWWMARLKRNFDLFDAVRIDHFLGFQRLWEIPAGSRDARPGRFVPGPRDDFFRAAREQMGRIALVAENLGLVTKEAEALRHRFRLPGMEVLQYSFGEDERYRPHNFERNSIVYTGTHDNDTTAGWFAHKGPEQELALRYAGAGKRESPVKALARVAWASVADVAILPAQDLLELGSQARMNRPGRQRGNWRWRMKPGALKGREKWLRHLTETYGRTP